MTLITSPFGSVAHSLAATVRAAKQSGEREISIPFGTYHVYADQAATAVMCVSNHGFNGFKSAAMVIEDAHDLTVNGNGSRFILHGCMDFAIINRAENITVRNLSVTCADTCNFQGRVTEAANGCVTVELEEHPRLYLYGDLLCQRIEHHLEPITRTLDYVTETGELRRGSGDDNFGAPFQRLKKTLDGDTLRLSDVPVMPPVGDTIVFATSCRCNQAFLLARSKNIKIEQVTVNTCWGMAFIAQKCENVTLSGCAVLPDEGRLWSAGQDGSHFVNCRGTVIIENSRFENQLDDAVNLHGIYTVVEDVRDTQLLVRYGHFQTRGIDIYGVGDKIQLLERESQQPLSFATITDVEVLNPDMTLLTLTDIEGEIVKGMIVEDLSDETHAIIRGNELRNNRARGMLIAAKGHVEIYDNVFHVAGVAIQFESDSRAWLESGGVEDVVIRDNIFDDCRYGAWGRAVIDICKRRKTVEGFYYHEKICIRNNTFTQRGAPCVCADNVKQLTFENNRFECDEPIRAQHCILNGEIIE